MADHVHTQIRAAAVTALTGLATSGARVYPDRLFDLADANLPGLRVYLDNESVETVTVHAPPQQQRRADLVVECCAKAASALSTTLDTMSKEVEIALAAGFTAAGKRITPTLSSSRLDREPGSTTVGVKRLVFDTEFFTLANAPDSLI